MAGQHLDSPRIEADPVGGELHLHLPTGAPGVVLQHVEELLHERPAPGGLAPEELQTMFDRGHLLVLGSGARLAAAVHCELTDDAAEVDLLAVDPACEAATLATRLLGVVRALAEAHGRVRMVMRERAAVEVG